MALMDFINGGQFRKLEGERAELSAADPRTGVLLDPEQTEIAVKSGVSARLIVMHTRPAPAALHVSIEKGATLQAAELFTAKATAACSIRQAAGSRCHWTVAVCSAAEANYTVGLEEKGAENRIDGFFIAGGNECCRIDIRTDHRAAECTSRSLVKGVAGGEATGIFRGLVHVAPGARRTDAQQASRNLLLSRQARIVAEPQLEIYADDVKCSHGATVGQLDDDAILYMRQRGLSEILARRLQTEGFVGDIAMHCPIEGLGDELSRLIAGKLQTL